MKRKRCCHVVRQSLYRNSAIILLHRYMQICFLIFTCEGDYDGVCVVKPLRALLLSNRHARIRSMIYFSTFQCHIEELKTQNSEGGQALMVSPVYMPPEQIHRAPPVLSAIRRSTMDLFFSFWFSPRERTCFTSFLGPFINFVKFFFGHSPFGGLIPSLL